MSVLKSVEFLGDTKKRIRDWPETAKKRAGRQLGRLQLGKQPQDFKPMPSVGAGVEELRVWDDNKKTYRVIYTARRADAVYVLHAFQKTTQQTEKKDIALAKQRLAELLKG
ncbi:MAG: type II toxin-antitoxin system RelE/ParE family toxin [Parvibaculum sp.]